MSNLRFRIGNLLAAMSLAGPLVLLAGCHGEGHPTPTPTPSPSPTPTPTPTASDRFTQTNLVSDLTGVAALTDPDLVNPWGIAASPTGPFWVADNGKGKSTLYNGSGIKQSLVVSIPSPTSATEGALTGLVYNGTSDFLLANGQPALFIFDTEDGTVSAWNSGTSAVLMADRSNIPTPGAGAVYKGLAIGSFSGGNYLYATNFRAGTVDVFDKNFAFVSLSGTFTDPALPAGFAPFGIQNIDGLLYVTYAKQDADKEDDVAGVGSGLINVFNPNGTLARRFATGSAAGGTQTSLNSPWGLALAPAAFGDFGNALLVGNFGDGTISAFNVTSGAFLGHMQNAAGTAPIKIPGLWGLIFGNGGLAGSPNVLFFTAGLGDPPDFTNNLESHGLFGSLRLAS